MIKLAVIGDPISHSLSPIVHGSALDALKVPYHYEKVQVKKGELRKFIEYAKKDGIDGFNLTMPHKTDIIEYLDMIDKEAELFGSVNTVKIKEGRLYGCNTDAEGYVRALNMKGYTFKNAKVVILGAGGVVSTLALKAGDMGAESITILNRTENKAEAVSKYVADKTGTVVKSGKMTVDNIQGSIKNCDILINATPLGMHGVDGNFEDLSFLDALPKDALVSDLIYNPPKTSLLKRAEELKNPTLNGLGMLIFQGLLADQIYLDMTFDLEKVYKEVEHKVQMLTTA